MLYGYEMRNDYSAKISRRETRYKQIVIRPSTSYYFVEREFKTQKYGNFQHDYNRQAWEIYF